MIESCVEVITPEVASQYLARNRKNRSIRKQEVECYAREIKRGNFVVTHQGIAFDAEGNLIDGQHRLLAIAMAGCPVKMMVTRGLDADTLAVVDRGATRTMRDVFTIGDANVGEMHSMMINGVMLSAMSQLVACALKKVKLTAFEMNSLFATFSDSVATAYRAVCNRKGVRRSQLVSAAIAAIHCGVSADAIEKFFKVFYKSDVSDCDGYNIRVALNWRRQIDDAKLQGTAMSGKKVYLGTQVAIWHFVNNTDASRVVVTNKVKYDVSGVLKEILGI